MIDINNYEHPTGTLTMNFLKPEGEANTYIRFGYGPQRIFYHNLGQVSVSISADIVNMNKQVNN